MLKILFVSLLLSGTVFAQSYSCLQKDARVKEADFVSKGKTVKQTLRTMKAKCWKGKLVDAKKREIYFYDLQGCWGNPPEDYLEVLDNQRKEIAELKKKYTVIEMGCENNNTILPRA